MDHSQNIYGESDAVTDCHSEIDVGALNINSDQISNEINFEKQLNMEIKLKKNTEQEIVKEELMQTNQIKKKEQASQIQGLYIQTIGRQQKQHGQQRVLQKKKQGQQKVQEEDKIKKQKQSQLQNVLTEKELKSEQKQQDTLIKQEEFHQNLQIKQYSLEPQKISKFSSLFKSSTINLNADSTEAQQGKYYFQNFKLILTEPITSTTSFIDFRLDNIKYCVGVGLALQQIVQKHQYDYKSTTSTEMGHGLYIVTSQGYSWSHSQQEEDDLFRENFNKVYSGVNINIKLQGENLTFKWKKGQFTSIVPSRIRQKYTLCFCAYLHEKTDSVSIYP